METITESDIIRFIDMLNATDNINKIIKTFVNCVIVYEDKVRILFNYKPNPNKPDIKEVIKMLDSTGVGCLIGVSDFEQFYWTASD